MAAFVRRFLRFGNLIKPTKGLFLNIWTQLLVAVFNNVL